jgi:hypothetical protein
MRPWNQSDFSPEKVRRVALVVAVVASIVAAINACRAVHNEFTGAAIYHRQTGYRHWTSEPVMRESSPDKFRSATNSIWAMTGAAAALAVIGVVYFRKLDDCVDAPF